MVGSGIDASLDMKMWQISGHGRPRISLATPASDSFQRFQKRGERDEALSVKRRHVCTIRTQSLHSVPRLSFLSLPPHVLSSLTRDAGPRPEQFAWAMLSSARRPGYAYALEGFRHGRVEHSLVHPPSRGGPAIGAGDSSSLGSSVDLDDSVPTFRRATYVCSPVRPRLDRSAESRSDD